MKVVHLVPAMEQGGVESVVCDLNRALSEAGHDAVVISRGGRLVARIERDGGRHFTLDLKSKNPLTYLWRVWRLRKLLKALNPDLVCTHSRVPAWLYFGVRTLDSLFRPIKQSRNLQNPAPPVDAESLPRPQVLQVSQSNNPNNPNNQTIQTIQTIKQSYRLPPWISYAHGANSVSRYSEVMTKGDLVVTPSRFLADYLRTNYPRQTTLKDRLRVIPNCVDTERFDPARVDRAFMEEKRREWGLTDADRVVMAIGRITPVKGYDALIRALPEENDLFRRAKLVIVGGADRDKVGYLKELKALAAAQGVADRVVFAGAQTKIPECIALADEVVSGNVTKPESFGLSVVEAYAMNKPVRAKRFGGVAEIMSAVEACGAASLRDAVLELYSFDRFAAMSLATYSEVLSESPACVSRR